MGPRSTAALAILALLAAAPPALAADAPAPNGTAKGGAWGNGGPFSTPHTMANSSPTRPANPNSVQNPYATDDRTNAGAVAAGGATFPAPGPKSPDARSPGVKPGAAGGSTPPRN